MHGYFSKIKNMKLLLPCHSRLLMGTCRRYCNSNLYTVRSHNCGQLNSTHVGSQVNLYGWLSYNRSNRFLVLKDLYGSVQALVLDKQLIQLVKQINLQSVVKIDGVVQARPEKDVNTKMKAGEIEVLVSNIEIVNPASASIRFHPSSVKDNVVDETVRLKYRYLDIRREVMQKRLLLRSQVISRMRRCLTDRLGFIEIETPTLFVQTPGGAAEFPVPTSRSPLGRFYSLVQSPQQFKQLLMVGGMDRYFQVARCYRDEKTSKNRQPEFTQLDIELSFTTQQNIRRLVEEIILESWPKEEFPDFELCLPFEEMKYADAMRVYGTDKPDVRFDWKLNDVTDCLRHEKIKDGPFSNLDHDTESLLVFKGPIELNKVGHNVVNSLRILLNDSSFNCPFSMVKLDRDSLLAGRIAKHLPKNVQKKIVQQLVATKDDVLVFAWGKTHKACQSLGLIRQTLARYLDRNECRVFEQPFKFLWIVDFPLFTENENTGKLESSHHPFTCAVDSDADKLREYCIASSADDSALKTLTGAHFDLVLNGEELGGGSMRIHDSKLQRDVLEKVLKLNTDHMEHLMDALASGAPPHGGIALGLDRYMSIVCGTESIRDVIAFPKSREAKDLMAGAPNSLPEEALKRYGLKVVQDLK